ncbi:hypothetical protein ABEV74_19995 [Paenibacillus cisolokensis]|uniref:hypothetical protein n=1 Tax=Paenibacillus cisolokensis TaxID=1658519 RepID=UPI003D268E7D
MHDGYASAGSARPRLGLQGSVAAWQDPWARERSDRIMRTGTGRIVPSQDPTPDAAAFVAEMKRLGADFYVHHMFPDLAGQADLIADMRKHGMDVCLGNEYGNINGPHIEGTNRYDVPDEELLAVARSGRLIGLLYDEPEHLQINAAQYRKDGFFPHWGATDGLTPEQSALLVASAVADRVERVKRLLVEAGIDPASVPLVAEHVFPVMFHLHARGGMAPCPKLMKESFQSLQLAAALGAAKQYGRPLWICADLWGPDVGPWFIRTPGFPGHSPEEFASALRLGYLMGPSHLFVENADAMLRYGDGKFRTTEFGEAWLDFTRGFVPAHPLAWSHAEAEADIAFVFADEGNYGQNARLLGNRSAPAPETTQSVFHVWHLLSHGTIPAHGSCMHIPGFDFPRHRLKAEVPDDRFPLERGPDSIGQGMHPLFYPLNNVLAFDEFADERHIGRAKLVIAAGSRISARTLAVLRKKAEEGAVVIAADWLVPAEMKESRLTGSGMWLTTGSFLTDDRVKEATAPFLGSGDCWKQRFGETEVRMYKGDSAGFTLEFEIAENSQM